MRLRACAPGDRIAVCDFWNDTFSDRRHFTAMTPARWREVIEERDDFDPARLVLAVERGRVEGLIHVGELQERECRRRWRDWPRGTMGLVMMLAVRTERRRRGIGGKLWLAGRDAVHPEQWCLDRGIYAMTPPLWGMPDGPAVLWDDSRTRKFLATRGYGTRSKIRAVELDLRLAVNVPALKVRTAAVSPSTHGVIQRKGKALDVRITELRRAGVSRLEIVVDVEREWELLERLSRAGFIKVCDWAAY